MKEHGQCDYCKSDAELITIGPVTRVSYEDEYKVRLAIIEKHNYDPPAFPKICRNCCIELLPKVVKLK